MDDSEEAWDLLENLKGHSGADHKSRRMGWALRLGDLMRHTGEVTFATDVLQHLIDHVIVFESDSYVRNELFNVVETSWGRNISVDLSLDQLMGQVNDDDQALTSQLLLLMAKSGDRKFSPFVQSHLTHANEIIRKNAEYAWKYAYGG